MAKSMDNRHCTIYLHHLAGIRVTKKKGHATTVGVKMAGQWAIKSPYKGNKTIWDHHSPDHNVQITKTF
jgi:hypothetical protein